ncbi:MAG: hypothetical protein M1829_000669 [Trizodia sp. TS-e1964]|nr:MAG: hypothetical protein M1829_000669 [Trizodia sp. TS-e1964]
MFFPWRSVALLLAAACQSTAHFVLQYPTSLGFDDTLEGTGPCGGLPITSDNAADFHVGGEPVAMITTHPAATWLFRATLDLTGSGNFSNLVPAISQTGVGSFCESSIPAPAAWLGQKGIVQVVQNAIDGLLYQCAVVNFVAGTASAIPSSCKNSTGVTATYTAAPALSTISGGAQSLVQPASISTSATASVGSSTGTGTVAAATSTAAAGGQVYGIMEPGLWFCIVGAGLAVGMT